MSVATHEEKTNFTMTVDKSTRDEFHTLCSDIGISMSSAINALMKQAVRQHGMSFFLTDENGFTPAEAAELNRRKADLESGNFVAHDLIEV